MICGLLLAAGGARRFKSQKLIVPYRGLPLVCHAARTLRAATDALVAVIGNDAALVREALGGVDARIVENPEWESGMSSSIRRGVDVMEDDCQAIVIGVGDQPGLDVNVVRAVITQWRETGRPIISASYREQRGHPVLFARSIFPELAQLAGDAGARLLIERSPARVSYVEIDAPVPPDVDTIEQLAALDG